MNTCLYCEYYNSCTGRCEVTGQKKDPDDRCQRIEAVDYDDWEH